MIRPYFYDVEVFPNFFSISIIDITSYLDTFKDACSISIKKGKEVRTPIPLIQKYKVSEIKELLSKVKSYQFYISDTDDSQLLPMLGFISNCRIHEEIINGNPTQVITDFYGYNSLNYDDLMIAQLLMNAMQVNNVKDLIKILYNTSKEIIANQDNYVEQKKSFVLNSIRNYKLPFRSVDVMKIFALNKVAKNADGTYIPKGLKQTSINLQWYELLEFTLPPIQPIEIKYYQKDNNYRYHAAASEEELLERLNREIEEWDRYIINEHIPTLMHYNKNDCFIGCEIVRLYSDEIKLRYTISHSYQVNCLSSSRSNIANKLFTKFYSEFSGLHESQWRGKTTQRTALAFKRVIFDNIKFKTPKLQQMLEEMKKIVIYSISKEEFNKTVTIGDLNYSIGTGGIHSMEPPRSLYSTWLDGQDDTASPSTGGNHEVYRYIHWDISSFYPSLMVVYNIAPAHMIEHIFVKLIRWLRDTRVQAKHSEEEFIDGIPKNILAEALKIVINSIYGKLGDEKSDICDRLAVLKVTINGQLFILMLCEELNLNGIPVVSANTDGIVVKLYKNKQKDFDRIAKNWQEYTGLSADSEEYKCYINSNVNNYFAQELNGKITYKGAMHPKQYAANLQKGYDMPIVAEAVVKYFLEGKSIMDTLYESTNILDFCKTQNIGKKFHVEETFVKEGDVVTRSSQRYCRFYVSNSGCKIEKVSAAVRNELCAGNLCTILNTLDDKPISERDINYAYYYRECMKIIEPIKLGISPQQQGDSKIHKTKTGKSLIKKYSGCYNTLFDDDSN